MCVKFVSKKCIYFDIESICYLGFEWNDFKGEVLCTGSFNTATCMVCKHRVDCETVRADIEAQVIPYCPHCTVAGPNPDAIMKPDIVFFHENLSDEFYSLIEADKDDCDLLIVIGSSLKVRPVAHIPSK